MGELTAWLQLLQWVVMAAAGLFVWLWTRGSSVGAADATVVYRLAQLEARVDHAGEKMSDLATKLQGFETRTLHAIAGDFLTRREAEILLGESRRDRLALWAELARGRDARTQ